MTSPMTLPNACSRTSIIDRPFEDTEWFNAIIWLFKHGQAILTHPRHYCQLTDRLEDDQVVVEKKIAVAWFPLGIAGFSWAKS
jgi:hypothetical protein